MQITLKYKEQQSGALEIDPGQRNTKLGIPWSDKVRLKLDKSCAALLPLKEKTYEILQNQKPEQKSKAIPEEAWVSILPSNSMTVGPSGRPTQGKHCLYASGWTGPNSYWLRLTLRLHALVLHLLISSDNSALWGSLTLGLQNKSINFKSTWTFNVVYFCK